MNSILTLIAVAGLAAPTLAQTASKPPEALVTKVWVNTVFDLDAREIQYVYFLPELLVTTIDVRFKIIDAGTTQVNVVYTRTALTPAGNEQVSMMSEFDRKAGQEWQEAIDKYLASVKTGHQH